MLYLGVFTHIVDQITALSAFSDGSMQLSDGKKSISKSEAQRLIEFAKAHGFGTETRKVLRDLLDSEHQFLPAARSLIENALQEYGHVEDHKVFSEFRRLIKKIKPGDTSPQLCALIRNPPKSQNAEQKAQVALATYRYSQRQIGAILRKEFTLRDASSTPACSVELNKAVRLRNRALKDYIAYLSADEKISYDEWLMLSTHLTSMDVTPNGLETPADILKPLLPRLDSYPDQREDFGEILHAHASTDYFAIEKTEFDMTVLLHETPKDQTDSLAEPFAKYIKILADAAQNPVNSEYTQKYAKLRARYLLTNHRSRFVTYNEARFRSVFGPALKRAFPKLYDELARHTSIRDALFVWLNG